ncbi:MAG: hypothetical protein NT159_08260 [Proteobacteria bacterium]|nr:hypothetical protein [Pseudomonadota bacterium]
MNKEIDDLRDALRATATSDLARKVVTQEREGGIHLSGEVSPCVWMYNSPFQIKVTLAGGGHCHLIDKSIQFLTATTKDIEALMSKVQIKACSHCGAHAFDPETVDTNRAGLCEPCFMADLNSTYQKEKAKDDRRIERLNARYKAKGYTHRVDAWVHAGGDDKQVSFYFKAEPTKDAITRELTKLGSRVLDDYSVHAL